MKALRFLPMDARDLRRRRARVLSAVLLLSATAGSAADLAKRSHSLVTADGRTRNYDVYFPAPLDPRELPLGLLIVLHGGAGSKEAMPGLTCPDGLSGNPKCLNRTIADSGRRYFVVYPDGTGALKSWNAGKCCGFAMENGVDDVGFIARLIDVLPNDYPYDPNRVYVTGFSNGAMLAHRLGCELAHRIAAIAPVAGGIGIENATCRPSRALPVLTFHGTSDPNYPYAGGVGIALPASPSPAFRRRWTAGRPGTAVTRRFWKPSCRTVLPTRPTTRRRFSSESIRVAPTPGS